LIDLRGEKKKGVRCGVRYRRGGKKRKKKEKEKEMELPLSDYQRNFVQNVIKKYSEGNYSDAKRDLTVRPLCLDILTKDNHHNDEKLPSGVKFALSSIDTAVQKKLKDVLFGKRLRDFHVLRRVGKLLNATRHKQFYGNSSALFEVRIKRSSLKMNEEQLLSKYPLVLKMCFNYKYEHDTKAIHENILAKAKVPLPDGGYLCNNVCTQLSSFIDTFPIKRFDEWSNCKALIRYFPTDNEDVNRTVSTAFFVYPIAFANLETHLKKVFVTNAVFFDIAIQLLKAIVELKNNNVVHMNICKENILVDHFGTVMLAGFSSHLNGGVIKNFNFRMKYKRGKMPSLGDAHHCPPEVYPNFDFKDECEIDFSKKDVFSAGVVLYSMFSAKDPFGGIEAPLRKNKHYVELPQRVNMDIKVIIKGMLNCDPTKRIDCSLCLKSLQTKHREIVCKAGRTHKSKELRETRLGLWMEQEKMDLLLDQIHLASNKYQETIRRLKSEKAGSKVRVVESSFKKMYLVERERCNTLKRNYEAMHKFAAGVSEENQILKKKLKNEGIWEDY
jgi:serine/threonine protein kinase